MEPLVADQEEFAEYPRTPRLSESATARSAYCGILGVYSATLVVYPALFVAAEGLGDRFTDVWARGVILLGLVLGAVIGRRLGLRSAVRLPFAVVSWLAAILTGAATASVVFGTGDFIAQMAGAAGFIAYVSSARAYIKREQKKAL